MYLPRSLGVRRIYRHHAPHLNMSDNNLVALKSMHRDLATRRHRVALLMGPDPGRRRLVMQALGGNRSLLSAYCAHLTEGEDGRDDLLTWAKLMQVFTPSPVRRRQRDQQKQKGTE